MKYRTYGDRGVLLSSLNEAERSRLLHRAESGLPPACDEYVLGYDSILLIGAQTIAVQEWLEQTNGTEVRAIKPSGCRIIEVDYTGADLDSVAQACNLTVTEVIELHSAPVYTVRMMGFSPGFPYLDGLDPRLHLDRRSSPRDHILPGTVAIGGAHAGIYSVASPGGWHLLGHTELNLFNLDAARDLDPDPAQVFALSVGQRIRFQPMSTP